MTYLLDTRIYLWMVADTDRLRPVVRAVLEDRSQDICLSAASIWEIATKRAKGLLHFSGSPAGVAVRYGLRLLDIIAQDCELSAELPAHHSDPFDRLLVAQALRTSAVLVTNDATLLRYDVHVLKNSATV